MDLLRSIAVLLVLGTGLASFSGCRLCADCDLDAYPSYGGSWQRTLRDSGRVGSVFDPGGSRAADLSARVDSESMEQELRNRDAEGDREKDDAVGEANEADDDQGDIRDRNLDNDDQLQDMEDRLRDLNLQDINYHRPEDAPKDWR